MNRMSVLMFSMLLGLGSPLWAQQSSAMGNLLPAGKDWGWWRGPTLDGKAPADQRTPSQWDEKTNILWKAEIPGRGHASPIVYADRVFTATADENAKTQSLVCYDAKTGRPRWGVSVHKGGFTNLNPKNSHASATPACDGERVYGVFINNNALWVTALTLDGKPVWQTKVGPFESQHGYGSSPALYKNLLIVNGDNKGPCYIAALDRKTGKIAWKTDRPAQSPSYATPILSTAGGREQILLHGGVKVTSYDPASGKLLWSADGVSQVTGNTIVSDAAQIYASGGYPNKELVAIKADGNGDVTRSHVVWTSKDPQSVAYCPSSIVHEGKLYVVSDRGSLTCCQTDTGKQIWNTKLGGGFSASLLLANGLVYAFSEEGVATVFKPGDKFEPVAENKLPPSRNVRPGGFMGSAAVSGNQLFVRCGTTLYCIGDRSTAGAN